jgi:hypothetical protein
VSNNVPRVTGNGASINLTNNNVYLPHYYTTTATGRPAWDDPHSLVEISNTRTVDMAGAARNPAMTYPGGPARSDCANPAACTYAEEIQNFANWFTYYRKRKLMLAAGMGQAMANVSGLRGGAVYFNNLQTVTMYDFAATADSNNARALIGNLYANPGSGGTPTRDALNYIGAQYMSNSSVIQYG